MLLRATAKQAQREGVPGWVPLVLPTVPTQGLSRTPTPRGPVPHLPSEASLDTQGTSPGLQETPGRDDEGGALPRSLSQASTGPLGPEGPGGAEGKSLLGPTASPAPATFHFSPCTVPRLSPDGTSFCHLPSCCRACGTTWRSRLGWQATRRTQKRGPRPGLPARLPSPSCPSTDRDGGGCCRGSCSGPQPDLQAARETHSGRPGSVSERAGGGQGAQVRKALRE